MSAVQIACLLVTGVGVLIFSLIGHLSLGRTRRLALPLTTEVVHGVAPRAARWANRPLGPVLHPCGRSRARRI